MFSRFHRGDGAFSLTCDLDFLRGIQFSPSIPALYDDGGIGSEKEESICRYGRLERGGQTQSLCDTRFILFWTMRAQKLSLQMT